MTPALLGRDPAVRAALKWALVGGLTTSVFGGIRALLAAKRGADAISAATFGDYLLLALALWVPVALFLAFGNVGVRCNRLDLTLPLSARRLSATHFTAVLLSGAFVLAIAAGVIRFHDWILDRIPARPLEPRPAVSELVLVVAVTMVLAAAVLLSMQPTVYRVPSATRRFWPVTILLLGSLGLILVLSVLPLAFAALPLAVAAVLAARSLRALPEALTLVPLPAVEDGEHAGGERWSAIERPAPASEMDARQRGLRRLKLDATLYRIFLLGIAPVQALRVPVNLISVPLLAAMGLILSGSAFENPIRLTSITLTAYMLLAFLAAPMAQLHLLDPLPVSRRRIFALLILPGLLAVSLGYGLGRVELALGGEKPAILFTSQPTRNHGPMDRTTAATVRVPVRQFRVAWNGKVPRIESPWGEVHEAWSAPLYEGSLAMAYSPFSTPGESSVDFVAWQISRAVEAVYGRAIPYEEIRDRYLEAAPEGGARLRDTTGLSLLEDYPDLRAPGEGPVFPVVILLTGLLYLAIGAFYFRFYRASVGEGMRKGAFFIVLGVALVLHVLPFLAFIFGVVQDWVVMGLAEAGILWLARTLPGGQVSVWILCAAIFALGYRLAEAVFERIEVPLPRARPAA